MYWASPRPPASNLDADSALISLLIAGSAALPAAAIVPGSLGHAADRWW
jgi:hypothetical protein